MSALSLRGDYGKNVIVSPIEHPSGPQQGRNPIKSIYQNYNMKNLLLLLTLTLSITLC